MAETCDMNRDLFDGEPNPDWIVRAFFCNKVFLAGEVFSDVQVKDMQEETPLKVLDFILKYIYPQGKVRDRITGELKNPCPDFVRVLTQEKPEDAKRTLEFLGKGSQVYVEGKLKHIRRSSPTYLEHLIVASRLQILRNKRGDKTDDNKENTTARGFAGGAGQVAKNEVR